MVCNRCGMNNHRGSQFCSGCAAPMLANNQNQQQQFHQGFNQNQQQHVHQGFNGNQMNQAPGASGRAITAMILSIAGLIFCGWLTSIPGMILGKVEMNAIRDGRASQAGSGFAKVGFYGGIAVTAFYGVVSVLYLAYAVLTVNY